MPANPAHAQQRRTEQGNAFFYIFLAVALFAGLSFAVSQGNRGSVQTLQTDREKLLATDIIEYSESIARAVAQIRLRGATPSQISFAHDAMDSGYGVAGGSDAEFEVFHEDGGGVMVEIVDSNAVMMVADNINFTGSNEFVGIGTTEATPESTDLMMIVRDVRAGVCTAINDILGIHGVGDPIPVEDQIDLSLFAGTYMYAGTMGNNDITGKIASRNAGCVHETITGQYVYYRVLLAR